MSSMTIIKKHFSDEEVAKIANKVVNELPLSIPSLRAAYTDEELREIKNMTKAVRKAKDKNKAIAENADTVLKLLKGIGLDLS